MDFFIPGIPLEQIRKLDGNENPYNFSIKGAGTSTPVPVISGRVFHDPNLSNWQDANEPGLAGVSLALWQWNGTTYVATHGAKLRHGQAEATVDATLQWSRPPFSPVRLAYAAGLAFAFDASLGGPIQRDKTWIFGAYRRAYIDSTVDRSPSADWRSDQTARPSLSHLAGSWNGLSVASLKTTWVTSWTSVRSRYCWFPDPLAMKIVRSAG